MGPIAGWPAHQSIEESLEVIKNVLSGREAYAICLKEDGKVIGAIELKLNGHTDMTECDDECELGYWLGKPFWGQGLMPEAAREILRHAFEDIGMSKVWCGYYEGNTKSKRVNGSGISSQRLVPASVPDLPDSLPHCLCCEGFELLDIFRFCGVMDYETDNNLLRLVESKV